MPDAQNVLVSTLIGVAWRVLMFLGSCPRLRYEGTSDGSDVPGRAPSRVAVDLDGVALCLVEDVDQFFVTEKHLPEGLVRGDETMKGDVPSWR